MFNRTLFESFYMILIGYALVNLFVSLVVVSFNIIYVFVLFIFFKKGVEKKILNYICLEI